MAAKARIFNHRTYRLDTTHRNKAKAEAEARRLRKEYMLARVVRVPVWDAMGGNGWGVYVAYSVPGLRYAEDVLMQNGASHEEIVEARRETVLIHRANARMKRERTK
jgi:hypothetical protein